MKKQFVILSVALVAAFTSMTIVTPASAAVYIGSVSTAAGTLVGSNQWAGPGVSLSWNISNEVFANPDVWQYSYTFTGVQKDVSHLIFGYASCGCDITLIDDTDVSNYAFDLYGPGLHGSSDEGIPGNLQGIKFNASGSAGTSVTVTFLSDEAPGVTDFFGADGKAGGGPSSTKVYVSNSAFGTPKNVSVTDGSDGNIMGAMICVPEPNTMMLVTAAGTVLTVFRRRSKRH